MYNINRFKYFYSAVQLPKQIQWIKKLGYFCLQMQIPYNHLYFISPRMPFKSLLTPYQPFGLEFQFPNGINGQTSILQFIISQDQPKTVKLKINNNTYLLKNYASSIRFQAVNTVLNNPNNIFNKIEQKIKKEIKLSHAICLTYYELCFNHEIQSYKPNHIFTEANRKQLMTLIMSKYFRIKFAYQKQYYLLEQLKIDRKINQINQSIQAFQNFVEKKYIAYRNFLALIISAYIPSVVYMVFFVQWLGWDIIQPITYTASIIPAILGTRFYLKNRKLREKETIKQIFQRMFLKKKSLLHLDQLLVKKHEYLIEKQRLQQHLQILKMRMDYGYFHQQQKRKFLQNI